MPFIDVPTIIGPLATRFLRRDSAAVAMPPAVNARPGEVQENHFQWDYTGNQNTWHSEKQVSKGLIYIIYNQCIWHMSCVIDVEDDNQLQTIDCPVASKSLLENEWCPKSRWNLRMMPSKCEICQGLR